MFQGCAKPLHIRLLSHLEDEVNRVLLTHAVFFPEKHQDFNDEWREKTNRSYPQLETEETPGRKGLKERNITRDEAAQRYPLRSPTNSTGA
jgi:hypothetical protein